MAEAMNSKDMISELKAIREDLDYLKEHMVDIDSIMTEDDFIAVMKAREEKKHGKLVKLEDLKKELGM